MLEINTLRQINEEATRIFEQINNWHMEQEAKEEKLKSLILENNRRDKKLSEARFNYQT